MSKLFSMGLAAFILSTGTTTLVSAATITPGGGGALSIASNPATTSTSILTPEGSTTVFGDTLFSYDGATLNSDLVITYDGTGAKSQVTYEPAGVGFSEAILGGEATRVLSEAANGIVERIVVKNTTGRDLRFSVDIEVNSVPNAGFGSPFDSLLFASQDSLNAGQAAFVGGFSTEPFGTFFKVLASDTDGEAFIALGEVGNGSSFVVTINAVPIPAAGLLFGSALAGVAFVRRRKLQQKLGMPA